MAPPLVHGGNASASRPNSVAQRSNDSVTMNQNYPRNETRPNGQSRPSHTSHSTSLMASNISEEATNKPSRDNCDRRRPDEAEDASRLPIMSQEVMGQTMTPFLREHIPGIYAPLGKPELPGMSHGRSKDPNSRFCYRHRPDSKCRRAADESKMALIQSDLEALPTADQQAISHVWSLFSAAPTKHRELMLQGIITQCCFPQLSTVSREVHEQLKIDFLSALPTELSYKILCFLDCVSLCKAAQVSRRWRILADDDVVWHRMCEQHIDRKCTACGWGLPRLEKKRLKDWKKQHQFIVQSNERMLLHAQEALTHSQLASNVSTLTKRNFDGFEQGYRSKRVRVDGAAGSSTELSIQESQEQKFKPWKYVYRERFRVGSNWKYGRCSIKVFRGEHTNGVTCLQFDDNVLATGSYDSKVKLWDIETGKVFRTLEGHTMGIRALHFDSRLLVSGSLDGTVRIFNWRTGVCINTLQHQGGVITVHMDGDLLASGSMDKSIKIFNFKTQQAFCLRGHSDWVNHVKLDVASRTVMSASDDCTIKLWDLDTKTCFKTLEGHVGQVQQILPLPDDFEVELDIPSIENDAASVTSHRSDTPPLSVPSHATPSQDDLRAAYGPIFQDDPSRTLPPRYILSGSLDATMRLWDTATGKGLRTFFGHVEGIWGLVGDSLRVVSGANDATVKIWDPRTGKCEQTFTGHAGPVTCVGLSDSRMASGGEDGEVRFFSFEGEPSEIEERGTPS